MIIGEKSFAQLSSWNQEQWSERHQEQLRTACGYSQIAKVKASWDKSHDLYYFVSFPTRAGWEPDKQTRRIYHPDHIDNRDGHVRAFCLAMHQYVVDLNRIEKDYYNAIEMMGCSVQQPKGEYLFFYQYRQYPVRTFTLACDNQPTEELV